MLFDPGGERGIALLRKQHGGAAQQAAVVGQVVAAEHGERCAAVLPACIQAGDQVADRAARCLRMRKVMHDIGVAEVQRIACQAIAFFGDGESDQAHCRIGEAGEHGRLLIAGAEHFGDGTDHAQLWLCIEQCKRVQAVLRAQRIAHLRVVQRHRADGPGGVVGEQVIDVDGLVRAMEGASA